MPLENEKIEVAEEKETEMPNVEELLKILLDVNLEQNRQTVHLLMNYMNDIEENFFSVLEELDTVKAQLAQVQQIPQTKRSTSYPVRSDTESAGAGQSPAGTDTWYENQIE